LFLILFYSIQFPALLLLSEMVRNKYSNPFFWIRSEELTLLQLWNLRLKWIFFGFLSFGVFSFIIYCFVICL
jgi:hypothetical protein